MITYERVLRLIEEQVEGTEHFLVELKMGEMNDITIIMDGPGPYSLFRLLMRLLRWPTKALVLMRSSNP